MPGPLAVAAYQGGATVARYVAKHGVKKATEKYGKAALKKVASKETAKSAATKTAMASGEGAAVRAVNNRRNTSTKRKKTGDDILTKGMTKAQKAAYFRKEARRKSSQQANASMKNAAAKATHDAASRGVRGKVMNDQREKRKRVADAKKAAKGVKGPIAKRKATVNAYKASGKKKRK